VTARRAEPVADLPVASVIGHLANPQHRRVLAAIELGAATTDDVAERTGLPLRDVVAALARLEATGLVEAAGPGGPGGPGATAGPWTLAVDRLRATARTAAARERPAGDDLADAPAEHARVLRAFLRDGRLLSMPVQQSKRRIVLDHVAQAFEPGRHYSEAQVNLLLGQVHADTAMLRRWLVDEGFLDRDHGWYWRAGGRIADDGP
jgi:hypothetical protein